MGGKQIMKLIKINDRYINADKIIQIYERPINPNDSDSALVTVIELEGLGTGNTGSYGELPYYYQNEVVIKEPLKEVVKLIHDLNTLNYLRKQQLIQPLT